MVNCDTGDDEFFDESKVMYYTCNYAGVKGDGGLYRDRILPQPIQRAIHAHLVADAQENLDGV